MTVMQRPSRHRMIKLLSDPGEKMLSASGTMESSMSKAGLDNRHRNKDGEISHKHGNTLIRTLRKIYGQGFAAGYPETEKLSEVLLQLNETSMSQLRRDHETGHLEHKIAKASKYRRVMAKTLLSMQALRWRALEEIRQRPDCSSVASIAINRVTDNRAESNWSMCVVSAGAADPNTAARAAIYVQQVLRRDYDLTPD